MNLLYDPSTVEAKWQQKWEKEKVYETDLKNATKPYYSMVMFPYPSGDKLHVGHWYNFAPADSFARFMRMQGFDVFEPMGFDAFGLPAENYAIKTGVHPNESIKQNVQTMIKQLKRIGCMYDWSKMVNTSDPSYYRWTQWLFLQMYKNGLAYKKESAVNYCPKDQTVLANEQVWEGKCERCGTEVVQKNLNQWFWNIKKYSQKLLDGLDTLDWPEKTKAMQRNWIGRSEGAHIVFEVSDTKRGIRPINWPKKDDMLAGGLNRRLTNDAAQSKSQGKEKSEGGLARDFNRGITDNNDGRIYSPTRVTHLVFTPHNRQLAFESSSAASSILRMLDEVAARHNILIHEACAMPDHVHLLVSFDQNRHLERDIVKKLKGASAREYLRQFNGEVQHLWGEGVHFEDVSSEQQFSSVLAYIQNNPKEAKISPEKRVLSALPLAITVFTTRPDTLFGATYMVLAPEHPLVDVISTTDHKKDIEKYRNEVKKKSELERTDLAKDKTGEFIGAYVINPANNEKIQVWIADYVLMTYGTGAVMAVPGHDERDFDFADNTEELRSAITCVIEPDLNNASFHEHVHPRFAITPPEGISLLEYRHNENKKKYEQILNGEFCWTGPGKIINSEFLNGLSVDEAKKAMIKWLEKNGHGKGVINYRLRDWLVSRQRYWGAPIPVVYDPQGKPHPVPEEHLPWLLPTDVEFKPTGESPLKYSKEFKERTEKIFGKGWTPEFDTMDTFVCSSFYYLRYLVGSDEWVVDSKSKKQKSTHSPLSTTHLIDPSIEKKWMPVSMYIGGPEHACMHLIYARFVMMALKDFGFVSHDEPFQRLVHQGLITNKGAKMSKSKGNVVSPDEFIERHGSDVFRMYLMFMGPFEAGGDWSDTGIKGTDRFVQRMYRAITEKTNRKVNEEKDADVLSALHKTIKKVTADIQVLHFNTAISSLMELLNLIEAKSEIALDTSLTIAKILAPIAPHLAEELWENLRSPRPGTAAAGSNKKIEPQQHPFVGAASQDFVINQPWPTFDPKYLVSLTMTIVVQVNGKVRANIDVASDALEAEILTLAKADANVQKFLEGKKPKKEIYVKGKLVSLVI